MFDVRSVHNADGTCARRAAVPGNVLNEVLGPRFNVGLAGVLGSASFVVCAIAPSFVIYLCSYIVLLGTVRSHTIHRILDLNIRLL